MAALSVVAAVLALEAKLLPGEIVLLRDLVAKIKGHKKPAAAIKAASIAVDATPQDGPTPGGTNDPTSPYFSE